jgi:ABC-type antimicrobial peptide transport system permease subunit
MIFKNLSRRKGRTILTLLGIAIGVAAMIALGAVSRGMAAGFSAMSQGSEADLVLTQANAISALISSVDQDIADELRTWPEVADVDGVLLANAVTGDLSYLFLFGYDPEGFAIEHFPIVEGQSLAEAKGTRGKPILLGQRAAEGMELGVGDSLHLGESTFRVVGIYETGDGFEDAGAVLPLVEAQGYAGQSRSVAMIYVQLKDPAEAERLRARVERRYPDLTLSTTSGFVEQEQMIEILDGAMMAISGLAIVIGGITMGNTLLMAVFERTREIGLLRSLGWRRRRVLALILGESLVLSLLGGLLGIGLGVAATFALSRSASVLSAFGSQFTPDLFTRALAVVFVLGLAGGAYPAWWASRLLPVEAMRYEGGSEGHMSRHLPGGMTVRNLWRRRTRTSLTLLAIGVSIAAVVSLGAIAEGATFLITQIFRASQTDLFAIQADVDADFSTIDERKGARIAARPGVEAVSGIIMTAVNTDEMPMLLVFGYHPREFAIRHFRVVEGEPLSGRRQVLLGRKAADAMGLSVGDTLRLLDSRFRVAGIYETGLSYEDIGVVIGMREAQSLVGKPRHVMYYGIKLHDPTQAEAVRDELGTLFPGIDFALTADVAEAMSDFRVMGQMVTSISALAVLIGTLGMLNTMLMSVLERTREIGVLRSLGWRRRQVLGMILKEALFLGAVGGVCGIAIGWGLSRLIGLAPGVFGAFEPMYTPGVFVQAVLVALLAGAIGGLYPAWRATQMRPVEALRYE